MEIQTNFMIRKNINLFVSILWEVDAYESPVHSLLLNDSVYAQSNHHRSEGKDMESK